MSTRRTAQERVAASARQVAADLLVVEQRQQAEVARLFARSVPTVAPKTTAAFRNSAAARTALARAHQRVMEESETIVARVVREAASQGARSIERELRYLERSLPSADRGRTVVTMRAVDPSPVVARALDLTVVLAGALQARWEAAVRDAGSRSKTPTEVTAALVGRGRPQGSWWSSSTAVQNHIRSMSIATVNAVRQDAMREFNEAA